MARTPIERVRVLGFPVDLVDMDTALAFVDRYIAEEHRPGCIFAVNPEKIYSLRQNQKLRAFFEQGVLLIPDGIGIVLAVRLLWRRSTGRTPGADLMERLCGRAAERGYRVFIYGAKEEANRDAVEELRRRYPGLDIVGRANGYVKPEAMSALVEEINASNADILFVALGSPRQEEWLQRNLPNLNVRICQGIGGTLDTIVGNVRRAPALFQALGLEWLYRLGAQPSRWRRQIRLPIFVAETVLERFRIKTIDRRP